MENYINYEFYKNTYKGNMPKNDFDRLVIRAIAEVRKAIMNRDISKFVDEVQLATCSVADILLEIEQIEQKKSKLISNAKEDKVIDSEKVGDLSRTFANTNKISELDAEISNQKRKIKEEIEVYLLTTGLLYRGVLYGRFI